MASHRSRHLSFATTSPGFPSMVWTVVVWVMLVAPTFSMISEGHVLLNHDDTSALEHSHGFGQAAEDLHNHHDRVVVESPGPEQLTTTGWLHDLMHHAQCSLSVFGPECVQLPIERLTTLVNLLPIPVSSAKVQGIAAERYRPPISA